MEEINNSSQEINISNDSIIDLDSKKSVLDLIIKIDKKESNFSKSITNKTKLLTENVLDSENEV